MKDIEKQMWLFLVGCIGVRSLLVYAAKTAPPTVLKYMGYAALVPAIGFAYIYLFGLRKTGPEVFGGKIWWNQLRPVHSFLYFMFAYSAVYQKSKQAYLFLLVDVLLGLSAFLMHHKNTLKGMVLKTS